MEERLQILRMPASLFCLIHSGCSDAGIEDLAVQGGSAVEGATVRTAA